VDLALLLTERQQPITFISDNDIYTALILRESEKLYNTFITKLINIVMATTAIDATVIRTSSLPSDKFSY
jgi:hypothetical protein